MPQAAQALRHQALRHHVAYDRAFYDQPVYGEEADGTDVDRPAPARFAAYAQRPAPARRRARRRSPLPALSAVAALALAGWAVLAQTHGDGAVRPDAGPPVQASAPEGTPAPRRTDLAWMLDPAAALGAGASGFRQGSPPASDLVTPAAMRPAPEAAPVRVAALEPAAPARPAAAPAPVATLVPLPVARPAELRRMPQVAAQSAPRVAPQVLPAARVAGRQPLPRTRDVFRAAMAEEPSFFDSLFGSRSAETPAPGALAYADPGTAVPRQRLVPQPQMSPSAGTAVYDITAATVTLPSGEVLEAHSGYGAMMDDPRYVHVRMRGATPPGTYEMTERERLFHGVRAIRLTPVGGSGAIHGRDGILAHTYMLRQAGASNGCVVFRDYDRFLQAFLRGDVRRLVVVAGGRGGAFGGGLADRAARRT